MHKGIGHLGFLVGAGIALFGALIHWVAPLLGPDWYAFLTAPQWVIDSARNRTLTAPVGAAVIGCLMFACALYAFSGAGLIRRLPLARTGLTIIFSICLLRGILVVPLMVRAPNMLSTFDIVGSMLWFIAGVAFLVGTTKNWSRLRPRVS